ncbi:serine hydrolase domain-containing protein [Paenarthrobacter sp. NCHU4564]|uniref:serine hydrolase domain-containing protein n=1 Tax=Paenarthrobacter sp. NCHU4564 TaxID=3451353 RepID=UPI003F9E93B7
MGHWSKTPARVVPLILALLLTGCTGDLSAPAPTAVASSAPTDSLETTLKGFIQSGVSAVVVQARWPGGEWSKAFGRRDPNEGEPAQPGDRFSIGSVTKSIVAVAVLQLVDEGSIGLDDPVNGLLISFQQTLRPPSDITVRQLLNHTSGMPDFVAALERGASHRDVVRTRVSMQRALELAATEPWDLRSVGLFAYSNSNYIALGQLVEKLRARPLGEVLDEKIFQPLGLEQTSLGEPDRNVPDNLRAYITVDTEQIEVTQPEVVVGSPAGGVVSTTEDVNDFYRGLLTGKLLSSASLERMKTELSGDYGLGIVRFPDACGSSTYRYGHPGSIYGYLTVALASDDGSRQVTLGMALPTMSAQNPDPVTNRRTDQYRSQLELAAQRALDQMCG